MSEEVRLSVWMDGEQAGTLWREAGGVMHFAYAPEYRTRPGAIPLSLSLPLSHEGPFVEGPARLFFANLLPEGAQRAMLARRFGLSEQNDFGLLAEIGGDCAGALSVLPPDAVPDETEGYRPVDRPALADAVRRLPRQPLLAGETGVRLSLAGVQPKLPVWYRDGAFQLPLGGPSTHIIKPPIEGGDARFRGAVHNEAFVMRLARAAGLPVPHVEIIDLEPAALLVERYDRRIEPAGRVRRLHQEDFCQALGVGPDQKYEADGGPALGDCFRLVRDRVTPPAPAVGALLDWVVFNALVANADAHAKNLSLLLREDGPTLAPFYDLLCTAAWDGLTERMAMRIGGESRPEWMQQRHWQRFAEACDLNWRLVRDRLRDAARRLPGLAAQVRDDIEHEAGDDSILPAIQAVIEARCSRMLDRIPARG